MFCSECRAQNNLVARYCVGCGSELQHFFIDNEPAPVKAAMPGVSMGTAPQADTAYKSLSRKEQYQAVIGSKQDYYLKKFLEFDREGKAGPSWHWPAFFVTFYWLLYRKMWRNALIYFVLPYLLLLLIGLVAAFMGMAGAPIAGLLYFAMMAGFWIVPALYADALYYNHCRQVIASARQQTSHPHRLYGVLSTRGGTSNIFVLILVFVSFVMLIGILAAIAIPAYSSYVMRAQTAEALLLGQKATSAVDQYYQRHHQFPPSLLDTEFTQTLPQAIKAVNIDSQTGQINIRLNSTNARESALLFKPVMQVGDTIVWGCSSQYIAKTSLPQQCQ
jgi:Tfp pilus assembly protein PilE